MDMRKAFEQGDFLTIIEAADQARTPEERLILGISLFKLGRQTDAMAVFLEVSEAVRDLSKVFFYMALIHKERGDLDAARFCIGQYTPFYPDDDEALGMIESGSRELPLISEASPELARIYAAQGHFEQALDIYVRLFRESGGDPALKNEARRVETMHIIKTLEGWLERIRK